MHNAFRGPPVLSPAPVFLSPFPFPLTSLFPLLKQPALKSLLRVLNSASSCRANRSEEPLGPGMPELGEPLGAWLGARGSWGAGEGECSQLRV